MHPAIPGRHFPGILHSGSQVWRTQKQQHSTGVDICIVLCLKFRVSCRMDSHSCCTKAEAKPKLSTFHSHFKVYKISPNFRKYIFQQQMDYKKTKERKFFFLYLFQEILCPILRETVEQDKCVDLHLRSWQQRQPGAFCRVFWFKEFKEYFLLQSQISSPLAGSCSTSYFDSCPRWTPGKDLALKLLSSSVHNQRRQLMPGKSKTTWQRGWRNRRCHMVCIVALFVL